MSCHNCQNPLCTGGCNNSYTPCTDTGCLIHLDFDCIFYHKDNDEDSALTGLDLPNGTTLEEFSESIDNKISQLNFGNLTFNILTTQLNYDITNIQEFAIAVDTEIGNLKKYRGTVLIDPSGLREGDYWYRTDLPAANGLRMYLNGTVRTIPTT